MTATALLTEADVRAALQTVDDPEYPGVSIVDLGLLEDVRVDSACVDVDLVPTFVGCPALEIIRRDAEAAIGRVAQHHRIRVAFVRSPVWTPERISATGHRHLAEHFTVSVSLPTRAPRCPHCGGGTREQSMFGPTRCRSVHRCDTCGEVVEVIR